mgnify:FL=1
MLFRSIDKIEDDLSQDIAANSLTFEDGTGFYLETDRPSELVLETYDINNTDKNAQNDDFETNVSDILDFTERNPFGEV